ERRLLFRHYAEGDGVPDLNVHGVVRGGAHRRLDRPVERDDRGSGPEDWLPAISMMAPMRESASTCARRSGVSDRSGKSAVASRSGVTSYCRISGMTFSPSTRLASTTD